MAYPPNCSRETEKYAYVPAKNEVDAIFNQTRTFGNRVFPDGDPKSALDGRYHFEYIIR